MKAISIPPTQRSKSLTSLRRAFSFLLTAYLGYSADWKIREFFIWFRSGSSRMSDLPRTERCLHLIWRRTLDLKPPFTPNRSVGRAIPDYVGANQWCRNDHHSLLITLKKSQLAIQFFHYMLPLCPVQLRAVSRVSIVTKSNKFPFPMILVWDRKRVNIARYSMEDHLVGWWVGPRTHFVFGRQTVGGRSDEAFSLHFWGVRRPSRASGPDVRWTKSTLTLAASRADLIGPNRP